MSGNFTTIGVEGVAWGTKAATLTRGIEAETTSKPSPNVEHTPSTGMRPGFSGEADDRHTTNTRGGTYDLMFDLLSKSHSMVLGGFATPVITTPVGATNARLHTITVANGTLPSQSIHDGVELLSGTVDHVDVLGAKLREFKLAVSPRGNVKATASYDYRTLDTAASSVTPSYASSPYVFRDDDVTTTLGGTAICQRGIDLTIPSGLEPRKDRICAGGFEESQSKATITPTGTLNHDLASFGHLDDWLAGTSRSLVFYIEGPEIEATFPYFLRITFAAVKFNGNAYERSLAETTGQPIPWKATQVSGSPIALIEYQTTDTAI